jgi:lipoyl(octanoyl) transferase
MTRTRGRVTGTGGYAGGVTGILSRESLVVRTPPGRVDYHTAWSEQRRLHAAVLADDEPDTVLLLEHPSVYTAGRHTKPWHRPADGTPVIETDRGGLITWHGPGQLVGYPIMKLSGKDGGPPVDVVAHVHRVEQLLIDVCAALGLAVGRVEGRRGVWVPAGDRGPDRKIAAIGVRVARGVSMHGFALNCDCDLTHYDRIVPCGITDAGVTSLSVELGRRVGVPEVLAVARRHLGTLRAG